MRAKSMIDTNSGQRHDYRKSVAARKRFIRTIWVRKDSNMTMYGGCSRHERTRYGVVEWDMSRDGPWWAMVNLGTLYHAINGSQWEAAGARAEKRQVHLRCANWGWQGAAMELRVDRSRYCQVAPAARLARRLARRWIAIAGRPIGAAHPQGWAEHTVLQQGCQRKTSDLNVRPVGTSDIQVRHPNYLHSSNVYRDD